MVGEIKKTEERKKAEKVTAQDTQKLDDDALDQVSGGVNGVDGIKLLDLDRARAEMDALMKQMDAAIAQATNQT